MRIIIIHIYKIIKYNLCMFKARVLIFLISFKIFSDCQIAEDKSRVIIAGGSLTEIVYFLEEEKNIVAVDLTSNFPPETANFPSIGYVRALSTEGVLSLNPTLILGEEDMGPGLVIEQLTSTGVDLRIVDEDYTLDAIINKILCISKILNIEKYGKEKIDFSLGEKISSLKKIGDSNKSLKKKVMIILGMDGTSPMVAGSNTSGNGFINMIGGENIMDSFDGWKPVSAESVIQGNPDLIIITKRGLSNFGTLEELAKDPSLAFTNAALNKNLMVIDGMSLLGFSPRTIDVANEVAIKLQSSE